MQLELVLAPDDAPRFLRLPLLAAAQRSRPAPQHIVWHDTADAALAASGIALAQERGTWRVEKLIPDGSDLWPPGAPAPVLSQAATPEQLDYELPTSLVPVVAFTGRRQVLAVETADGLVTATLLRGSLRAVTTEHAVSRLNLAGEERAVLQVALNISTALPATIASMSLAAFALTSARGLQLPTRQGVPELPGGLDVGGAFAFVLAYLTSVLLHFAPAAATDAKDPEPVHQMRVALRRLRSTIKVFQRVLDCDELRAIRSDLKALNGQLGPARDWAVFLGETLPAVQAAFREDPRLGRLVTAAVRRGHECHAALRDFLLGQTFRRVGIVLAWLAGAQGWRSVPLEDGSGTAVLLNDFAAEVLDRRFRKLTDTEEIGELAPAELHAVRLKAKQVRYSAEIFAPIYGGKPTRRFINRLAALQNLLGTLNDGATARRLLEELGGPGGRHAYASGLVLGFIAARSSDQLPQAVRRWSKLKQAKPFWD